MKAAYALSRSLGTALAQKALGKSMEAARKPQVQRFSEA
jgi:hypothetical protein